MAVLESQAHKKLRSFALFPAKKKAKYESAYALFGAAVRAHLSSKSFGRAGDCLRNQGRIAINKLRRPVESAAHYMEACRAYMLASQLEDAFECLQLGVRARTKPGVKHKGDALELSVSGITVSNGSEDGSPFLSPDTQPVEAPGTPQKASPTHLALMRSTPVRSPALTGQAGTIQIEGRGLYLSPETMQAPISSATQSTGARSLSIQPHPPLAPCNLFGSASATPAAPSPALEPTPATQPSSNNTLTVPPPARMRRHSLSGSANSSNVTADGVVQTDVLHLDLLLARLAVQLATDLWTDLDFRDAILALEIASSLFATLLIAERNTGGTFHRRRMVAPLIVVDPPLKRAESVSSPNTPLAGAKDSATLAIEERLAGLLGPSAYSMTQSSQTLGAFTLPISSKPIPSLAAQNMFGGRLSRMEDRDASALVLHTADPHLSVSEGEESFELGTTILEESLVCRFQLANYYITWDEELGDDERSSENQELRRSKALFEQVASQKPDVALVHATLLPILTNQSEKETTHNANTNSVDDVCTLIAEYAADDDKLHACLFLAGLCDALIGIRVYQASQVKPAPPVLKAGKAKHQPVLPPPAVPPLYLMTRTVWCPPILLRYREMAASFGNSCEIRFLRACNGLLQLAANLPQRLNDAFGGKAPHAARQLFQAAWGAEILREYSEVIAVYSKQKPLTSIVSKILFQIRAEMKKTISG